MTDLFNETVFGSQNPLDVLNDITSIISAVTMLFEVKAPFQLSDERASGIYLILAGCGDALDGVKDQVETMLDELNANRQPQPQGASDDYARGAAEGREALLRAVAQHAPDLAGAIKIVLAQTAGMQR